MNQIEKGPYDVFKLDEKPQNPFLKFAFTVFKKPLEVILDFKGLNSIRNQAIDRLDGTKDFAQILLDVMNIKLELDEKALERIPKEGKVVIVANHPFGGIEGVILGAIIRKVRPDIKIMANYMLGKIPELRDLFYFVNPFETKEAIRENLKSMKETIAHLNNNGAFGVFPAGTVSHRTWSKKDIIDPEWSNSIARIVRKTEAPVLPIYFHGTNGPIFQTAGLIHPMLRTALLPRQFTNKQQSTIRVCIGKSIPYNKLKGYESDSELIRYLRQRTYLLQGMAVDSKKNQPIPVNTDNYEEIIDPVSSDLLKKDVDGLGEKQLLLNNSEYDVYYASYKQIPNIIREIGRLREYSFRATDEGTGKSIDVDKYDEYYMHMFVWQRDKQEVVGAYRLGKTDDIIKEFGQNGLYTTTLFKMKPDFFKEISPALEMGRSFVRPEYQRSFAPLLLLWKGIGHYVVKFPKYKILFGPVSISNDYKNSSRNLMVKFLTLNNFLPDLAKQVKPKMPFKADDKNGWKPEEADAEPLIDIDDVSDVISFVESDAKGVPILIKQYLKLGGKMLGFNIDPDFADALDGLILVDLTKTDPSILVRYMDKEGMAKFVAYHSKEKTQENHPG